MFPDRLRNLAMLILDDAEQARLRICTAESCTGGLVAALLTDIPGSSSVFERGFVTYSNLAKQEMLGVSAVTLERFGAVSRETAIEMATGALAHSQAQLSVAVTGIAGPGGGTPEKPVGTVWLAWATADQVSAVRRHYPGDRAQVRAATIDNALRGLVELVR